MIVNVTSPPAPYRMLDSSLFRLERPCEGSFMVTRFSRPIGFPKNTANFVSTSASISVPRITSVRVQRSRFHARLAPAGRRENQTGHEACVERHPDGYDPPDCLALGPAGSIFTARNGGLGVGHDDTPSVIVVRACGRSSRSQARTPSISHSPCKPSRNACAAAIVNTSSHSPFEKSFGSP
jgi:hypothetical protein